MTSPSAHTLKEEGQGNQITVHFYCHAKDEGWGSLECNILTWNCILVKIEQNAVQPKCGLRRYNAVNQKWQDIVCPQLFLNSKGSPGCNILHEMRQISNSEAEKRKRKKGMGCNRGGMSGINASSLSSGCGRRLLPEIIFRKGWCFNPSVAQCTNKTLQYSFHLSSVSDSPPSSQCEEMICKWSPE